MPNNDDGIANQDTELAPPDAVDVIEDTVEGVDEGDLQVPLGRQRIIIEKNDRSLAEFHRWYKEGRLIVDPEWQRNYVWTLMSGHIHWGASSHECDLVRALDYDTPRLLDYS